MGCVDLLITNEKELYTVIEFKNIPLNTLDIEGRIINDKAKLLEGMILKEILQLRFDGNKRGRVLSRIGLIEMTRRRIMEKFASSFRNILGEAPSKRKLPRLPVRRIFVRLRQS